MDQGSERVENISTSTHEVVDGGEVNPQDSATPEDTKVEETRGCLHFFSEWRACTCKFGHCCSLAHRDVP